MSDQPGDDPGGPYEPFAGGLGAGLTLLDRGAVSEVWFYEANPALAVMWQVIVDDAHGFAALVEAQRPSLAVYDQACETVAAAYQGDLSCGQAAVALAAFTVNRCSRSGIVAPNVGPIGGRAQAGRWTIESRFDPHRLADRVRHIGSFTSRMRFCGPDGIAGIEELDGQAGVEDEVVLFVDPPYVREGNRLYANGMTREEHLRLAAALNATPARWALTYDDEPVVADQWYPQRRVAQFDIAHTANRQRVDREYLVLSPGLFLPDPDAAVLPGTHPAWLRGRDETWAGAV